MAVMTVERARTPVILVQQEEQTYRRVQKKTAKRTDDTADTGQRAERTFHTKYVERVRRTNTRGARDQPQLYDLLRWKFLSSTNHCRMSVALLYDIFKLQSRTVYTLESRYGNIMSVNKFKGAILDQFKSSRQLDLVTQQ